MITAAGVAKTIATDNHARVKNDPVPQTAPLSHDDIGMKHALRTDLYFFPEKHPRENYRTRADPYARADKGIGENRHAFAQDCAYFDMGLWANGAVKLRRGGEKLQDLREGDVRVRGLDIV